MMIAVMPVVGVPTTSYQTLDIDKNYHLHDDRLVLSVLV